MQILLTNDDGIRALGIKTLARELINAGHTVTICAPMRQQSGVSQCLTIFEPLRIHEYHEKDYHGIGIYGTPADCVKVGLGSIVKDTPDLIVSGMNLGRNVGPDLLYSGTVAAAIEGCQMGIPSVALSYDNHDACDVTEQAKHATSLLSQIDFSRIPPRRVININYPNCPLSECKGIRICPQSPAIWENVYERRVDPNGNPYFWLIGNIDKAAIGETSDIAFLQKNYITVSPLRFDFTDTETLPLLEAMGFATK